MSEQPPPVEVTADQKVESKDSYSWLAAIGIGALAVYIGKIMYESYKPHVPQLLWPSSRTHKHKPAIYCVNFPPKQQALLLQALSSWFTEDEVDVLFESMMIIDEEDEPTNSNLANVTKGAARVAFRSVQENHPTDDDMLVLVYRSAVSLNNDSVDIFEQKHEKFLTRAAGKSFQETHCVGFTRDGRNVDTLQNTMSGVVDAALASEEEGRDTEVAKRALQKLANCVYPSKSSFAFKNKTLSSLTGSDPSPSVTKDELTKLNVGGQCYCPSKASGLLWTSPFPLFFSLGASLRYSRAQFGGTKLLLQIVKGYNETFFGNAIDFFCRSDKADIPKLKNSFQGHFLVVFVVEGLCDLTGEALSFTERYILTACEVYTGTKPSSNASTLVHVIPHNESTLIVLNLDALKDCCSVLQALKIELALGALLSTFNLNITVAKLGVVRAPVAATILWPSEANEDGHFFSGSQYWVYPSTSSMADMAAAILSRRAKGQTDADTGMSIYILSEIVL